MLDKKSNIRSFRYSDTVAAALNDAPGDSLNQKFENLVLSCHAEIPKKQEELKRIQKMIDDKQIEYRNLTAKFYYIDDLIQTLNQLKSYGERATKRIERLTEDESVEG